MLGLLRTTKSADTSADSFVPLLIYTVLQANPDHLVSNVQYIMRFRNQDKLSGEAGYYLSSLVSEKCGILDIMLEAHHSVDGCNPIHRKPRPDDFDSIRRRL